VKQQLAQFDELKQQLVELKQLNQQQQRRSGFGAPMARMRKPLNPADAVAATAVATAAATADVAAAVAASSTPSGSSK
jgi:hypothetical protein